MKYVIGIDGGGTKSTLILSTLDGKEIVSTRGGPTNIYATNEDQVRIALENIIKESLDITGLNIDDCAAICLGSSGIGRPYEREIINEIFKSLGVKGKIILTTDAETALVAGAQKQEGIIIISGTGSLGWGKTNKGKEVRVGGWGHKIGDEGGGYYIAIKAITAAVRSYDGREAYTELLPMIMSDVGIKESTDYYKFVYEEAGKKEIADLAKVVNRAFQKGDKKAKEILEDSTQELLLKAETLIRELDFETKRVPLVLTGSIFLKIDYVYNKFSQYIRDKYPLIEIVRLERDAAYGAVQIAIDKVNGNYEGRELI